MKTKLAPFFDASRALYFALLRRRSSFLACAGCCLILLFALNSAHAGDDTALAPPPVKYVEDFTNATTPKIDAAKTWAVYPSAVIYAAPSAANATVVTNGATAAASGQPVTAPPNPAAQAPTAPAATATPPPADPDNVPNNFQASPDLQGAH